MATWNMTATDEQEEVQETLSQKLWGKVTGFWGIVVKALIILFLAWLFFFIMGCLSTEIPEKDLDATYESIASEDNDAIVQKEDVQLWKYMIDIANSLDYIGEGKEFELGMEKSREFGAAYFQPSDAIYVKEVKFYDDASNMRTAEITYELGVNKNIRFVFKNNHITKEMTRFEGFSEGGSFLRYLKWYTYGRFMRGYPRYTCDVVMENGREMGTQGSRTATKSVVKMMPFNRIVRTFQLLRNVL